jgi:membrane associated rhomboid family serine protease
MILVVLFGIGFLVALAVASLFRHARSRVLLVATVALICVGYAIYIAAIASCPDEGECDKAITIVYLAAALLGWIVGAAASWLVRRPEARSTELPNEHR